MQTLQIGLTDEVAAKLRKVAAQENTSVEDVAARLLSERLSAEFDVTESELAVIQEAVDDVRAEHFGRK